MSQQDLAPDLLLQACACPGASDAWREFMRRYHPVLAAAATRVSRQRGTGATDEIDDVIQEIYLRLCADHARALTSCRDTRPEAIFGYLKVVATNIAHDYFRRCNAVSRGVAQTVNIDEIGNLGTRGNEVEQRITLSEIDEKLIAHTQSDNGPRDRTVFRLYYMQGLTARNISSLPGIGLTPKGVEGVLHRLTAAIRVAMNQAQEMGAE